MESKFAVIENGIVVNLIVGVEPEVLAENPSRYVLYTDENPAIIGGSFDGQNFIPPQNQGNG